MPLRATNASAVAHTHRRWRQMSPRAPVIGGLPRPELREEAGSRGLATAPGAAGEAGAPRWSPAAAPAPAFAAAPALRVPPALAVRPRRATAAAAPPGPGRRRAARR